MGSDLARITYDPTRSYRSVVAQQGRVTLEADTNEQALLAAEALRLETLDIVGPCGTPGTDDYEVVVKGGALNVRPGTMYVGGWRMTLPRNTPLDLQPEWLDQATQTFRLSGNALIALLVTEQDVSAVEDPALREVALGGPDTAARSRLMQRIIQMPTSATLCDPAQVDSAAALKAMGLTIDRGLEIKSVATLEVSFVPAPSATPDACCPPAQGGFLGSDNQLVLVKVISLSGGSGNLLWAWNNASFLYGGSFGSSPASAPVLQLAQTPVDTEHTPQNGQFVEILNSTAKLENGSNIAYVAAASGVVLPMSASGATYDPIANALTLPANSVTLPTDGSPVYVRIWQSQVAFTSGTAVPLDPVSGLAVTIRMSVFPSAPFLSQPFWRFAVRPNMPNVVYPQRYTDGPQRPDGPRQWICDLAIMNFSSGPGWTLVADCRKHFTALTEPDACSCCNLVLDPSEDWVGKIAAANTSSAASLSLCFQPGTFHVGSTLSFAKKMVKIVGSGPGTILLGANLEVVVEFDTCGAVTLSDIAVTGGVAGFDTITTSNLQGAVTVRGCTQVDIERVTLSCADGEIRAACCLYVINPIPTSPQQFNVRVSNSQFYPGQFQAGILMVNADRAVISGNLVFTPQRARKIRRDQISQFPHLMLALKKQLVYSLSITDTAAPPNRKARARLLKQRNSAGTVAPTGAAKILPQALEEHAAPAEPGAAAPASAAPEAKADAAPATTQDAPAKTVEKQVAVKVPIGVAPPAVNIGRLGRGRVTASFGSFKVQFISSEKLGNAWVEAIAQAGLTSTSTAAELHAGIHTIVDKIFTDPDSVPNGFASFVNAALPQLYSTAGQGIVIGGNVANDIRILDNTVDGTAQGIHVGLSDCKASPVKSRLPAGQVEIRGNRVNIRLTPEMSSDRHGIYVGSVTSASIDSNHLELTRLGNALDIYAIKVAGAFGPRLLIQRNYMKGFTFGVYTQPVETVFNGATSLWKISDNASDSGNAPTNFLTEDNLKP